MRLKEFLSPGRRELNIKIIVENKTVDIRNVMVVGVGLMGSGIAQVCAQAGLQVNIYDVDQEALEKSLKNIAWSVGKLVEKGKVSEPLEKIMGRISTAKDFSPAGEAQLVIEAVFENLIRGEQRSSLLPANDTSPEGQGGGTGKEDRQGLVRL